MSIRSIVVVILALVCGASAAVGVLQLRQSAAPQVVQPETVSVVVASREIPRGRMVTADDLRLRELPKEAIPEGTLTKAEDAVDRAVVIQILAGEFVLDAKLAGKDAGRGLAALVPKGMRAFTIQASRAATSVAGFILPGNKVDVLLNLRAQGAQDETGGGSTTTLLQSIEILAVEQRLDAPTENKTNYKEINSVTLLVTPEQAALLDLGQNMGQLTLSLRNPEDTAEADTRPATIADIRFRQEKPAPAAEPKPGESKPAAEPQTPPPEQRDEPQFAQIVTLRGNQRGRVLIELNR